MAVARVLLGSSSHGCKSRGGGWVVSLQIHAIRVGGSGRSGREALLYMNYGQHITFWSRTTTTLPHSECSIDGNWDEMILTYLLFHLHVRTHGLDSVPALDHICLQRDRARATMQLQEETARVAENRAGLVASP